MKKKDFSDAFSALYSTLNCFFTIDWCNTQRHHETCQTDTTCDHVKVKETRGETANKAFKHRWHNRWTIAFYLHLNINFFSRFLNAMCNLDCDTFLLVDGGYESSSAIYKPMMMSACYWLSKSEWLSKGEGAGWNLAIAGESAQPDKNESTSHCGGGVGSCSVS